jgi:hypothetical protein
VAIRTSSEKKRNKINGHNLNFYYDGDELTGLNFQVHAVGGKSSESVE